MVSRLFILFVLLFSFGVALLYDSFMSSFDFFFPDSQVQHHLNNNRAKQLLKKKTHKQQRIRYNFSKLSRIISNNKNDEDSSHFYDQKQVFRVIQNAKIIYGNGVDIEAVDFEFDRTSRGDDDYEEISHTFVSKEPITAEECRKLCVKRGKTNCAYFSRRTLLKKIKPKKHRQQQFSEQSGAKFAQHHHVSPNQSSFKKFCLHHVGIPNIVSTSKISSLEISDEVWLPESIFVDDEYKSPSNLVAIAVQVVKSHRGIESVLGSLATWLKYEPNVAVFLDRTDKSHVGMIADLLSRQKKTEKIAMARKKNPNFNSCVKIKELLELFVDVHDGADMEQAMKDFLGNTSNEHNNVIHVDESTMELFQNHDNNKNDDEEGEMESYVLKKFNHLRGNNINNISLSFFETNRGPSSVFRPQLPFFATPLQSYIGPASSYSNLLGRNRRKDPENEIFRPNEKYFDRCFSQFIKIENSNNLVESSSFLINISEPLPNIFLDSSPNEQQSVVGFQFLRFLNPSINNFLKYGLPPRTQETPSGSGSWLSLRAMHETFLFFPTSSWYFLVEEGTFGLMRNLRYYLLLASLSQQHLTSRSFFGHHQSVNHLKAHRHDFISSKSGILIPRSVLEILNETRISFDKSTIGKSKISLCLSVCRQNYIDERISCCMHGVDVKETHINSFFPLRPERAVFSGNGNNKSVNFTIFVSFSMEMNGGNTFSQFLMQNKIIFEEKYERVAIDRDEFLKDGEMQDAVEVAEMNNADGIKQRQVERKRKMRSDNKERNIRLHEILFFG